MFASLTIFENPTLESAVANLTSAQEDVLDGIGFPTWNSTYQNHVFVLWNTTIDGGFFSGGATVQWLATFPDGWIIFIGDFMQAGGQWFIDIGEVFFFYGIIAFEIITPPDMFDEILNTIFIIPYAIIYLFLAIGLISQGGKLLRLVKPIG